MPNNFSKAIGYTFKNEALLTEALTHPSFLGTNANKALGSYEKLEFLGDAVLSLLIAKFLFENFPADTEGALTKKRAALINGEVLFKIGTKIGILEYIHIAKSFDALNEKEKMRITEDALEALIGALYLDGGMDVCEKFIKENWADTLHQELSLDAKTELQEWSQRNKLGTPKYSVLSQTGQAHAPIFTVAVSIKDMPEFTASSYSKKTGSQEAAKLMLEFIKNNHR